MKKYKYLKYLFIFLVILFFINKNIRLNNIRKLKLIDILPKTIKNHMIPDILISPGGRYGSYQLGICHYIKNHFDIKNKKILGFSAGSWNTLFMSIDKKYTTECLKKFFKIKTTHLPSIMKQSKNIIEEYNITDYNIKNIYIASSTLNGLVIYNNFITTQDLTRCCMASSFIPYLTYNDILFFYKNCLSADGGVYCKNYIKTIPSSTLIISFKMFGRYKNMNIFKEFLKKKKPSIYDLYIKGYRDACKNHTYFEKYLNSIV